MPFAAGLRESLEIRGSQVPSEFTRGDSLERVLDRHLAAIERNFDGEVVTSVLLLSSDGKRLTHGAGPSLPKSYRDAVDGSPIGPCVGSCGTAAFFGRPVYVTDIATNPLWADYRHLALPHGFRSCWSTPIRDKAGTVVGTFATYHRRAGSPTLEEIDAIDLITEHVADAIAWARGVQDLSEVQGRPHLHLVANEPVPDELPLWPARLLERVSRLEQLAAELERQADREASAETRANMRSAASESRKLISAIRDQIEGGSEPSTA